MAGKAKFSKRTVREAIQGSRGNVTLIATRLGVTRQTVKNYLARYPELEAMIEDERDSILDLAESKLYGDVAGGDQKAYLFVLETMGKNRGWSKRTEVTGKDGLPLSPDVMSILSRMGYTTSDVAREFEAMIREMAEANG